MRRILALRLETDRLVRARPIVSRALRGFLEPAPYAELLDAICPLVPAELEPMARRDLESLSAAPSPPLPALRLYRRALGRSQRLRQLATEAGLAIVGTSWAGDAAEQLRPSYPDASGFLEELSWRGSRCLQTGCSANAEFLALLDLTRGAFLGQLAQLELRWPAPQLSTSWVPAGAQALPHRLQPR